MLHDIAHASFILAWHKSQTRYGISPWLPLLGLQSCRRIFFSSHRNSFEDWAPVDFIYRCPILKWIEQCWLHERVPEWHTHQWPLEQHVLLSPQGVFSVSFELSQVRTGFFMWLWWSVCRRYIRMLSGIGKTYTLVAPYFCWSSTVFRKLLSCCSIL